MVFFLIHRRQYLLGKPFLVRTDHFALQWLRRTPEPIGQQSRWLEVMEEFNFTIEHRPGAKHIHADALSRRPCRQCGQCGNEVAETEPASLQAIGVNDPHVDTEDDWSPETISRRQSEDPDIGPIFRAMKDGGEPPAWNNMLPASQSTKIYWTLWSSLELCNGVLYLRSEGSQSNSQLRLISPPSYRDEIMHQVMRGLLEGTWARGELSPRCAGVLIDPAG